MAVKVWVVVMTSSPGPDAERLERQVQAGGGRVDGDRLQPRLAEEGREVVLEAPAPSGRS